MAATVWQQAVALASAAALMAACGQAGPGDSAAGQRAAETPAEHPGKGTYVRYCHSCHAAGVAGAPLLGEPADWEPRIARGMDAMLQTTLAGVPPGMPPKGLCVTCDEEELREAIDYMVEAVR